MFSAYGEVDFCLALGAGIQRSLHQMLFERSARTVRISVELQEALGKLSVIEALVLQHIGHYGLVLSVSNELVHALTFVLAAGIVQILKECEVVDVIEISLLKRCGGLVIGSVKELEHILEHTACRTAGGHKLGDDMSLALVLFPGL